MFSSLRSLYPFLSLAMVRLFPPLYEMGMNLMDNYQSWGEKKKEEINNDSTLSNENQEIEVKKLQERINKFHDKFAFINKYKEESNKFVIQKRSYI
jgi:hypothetical protein